MVGALNKYLAELLGTFVLVVIGSLAVISAAGNLVAISLGFGLAFVAAIYMFGSVSGGHFNPALTFARVLRRELTGTDLVGYAGAQLAGALLASGLVAAVAGTEGAAVTVPVGGDGIASGEVLVLEAILTAVLVIVFLRTASGDGQAGPIALGLVLTVIHLAALSLTGAAVNPARSLGPAIIAVEFTDAWVYILGPLVGAIIGVYVERFISES